VKLAALITCHNRKINTINSLKNLYLQVFRENTDLKVFLTDDGSTDGTSNAVREAFPNVYIINGSGALFWNGGMRLAWDTAMRMGRYDFFLWLNDDTVLKPDAIAGMVATAEKLQGVIIGSCHDADSGIWTYGGRTTPDGKKCLSGIPVIPSDKAQPCQQINGNVVLVPKSVVEKIGILSERFTHAMGDFDYGFRALDAGIPLYVAPYYQATCSHNPLSAWCNPSTPFRTRLALFNSPKGINFSEFMFFCRRHFGVRAYAVGAKVLFRLLIPGLWVYLSDRKQKRSARHS